MRKRLLENIGPGPLIAAAFIGPGTVTLCTLVGVKFGLDLLWAIGVSILAAIALQGMAVRLGMITGQGIVPLLLKEPIPKGLKIFLIGLILGAILVGNTAYEAGNISGAVLGLETLFGQISFTLGNTSFNLFSVVVGCVAGILLWLGKYKLIERTLIGLVALMSITFLITAIATGPSLLEIGKGLFSFSRPQGSLLSIIGLVGTTIVPYNLFLHSALVREKWKSKSQLPVALQDMRIAIGLGGFISISIIITAAGVHLNTIENAADLALGLEPLFGTYAKYFLSIGLFAAGITSTLTAPLAAAYVTCDCFQWKAHLSERRFRIIGLFILLFGVVISATGLKLILIIQFAQIINGLLLPIIAGILLWMINNSTLMGTYKNNRIQNSIGVGIVLITLFLSFRTLIFLF